MLPLLFPGKRRAEKMNGSFPTEQIFPRLALFMLYVRTASNVSQLELFLAITICYVLILLLIYHVPDGLLMKRR